MAYRARAKTVTQAVARATHWIGIVSQHSLSSETCWNTKLNRRLRYVEVAEAEEFKHLRATLAFHGSVRAAVAAGRYERAPTW